MIKHNNIYFKIIVVFLALLYFISSPYSAIALSREFGSYIGTDESERYVMETYPFFDPTACVKSSVSSTSPNYAPSGDCIGVEYPNVVDESKFASGINDYIKNKASASPLNGKGNVFVEAGKKWGVNPALIVNIARKETVFGQIGSGTKFGSNNPFGIKCRKKNPEGGIGCPGKGTYQGYANFDSAINGAAELLRLNYIDKGLRTVDEVFPKYAPSFENDTATYIREVKGWMQEVIDLSKGGVVCGGISDSELKTNIPNQDSQDQNTANTSVGTSLDQCLSSEESSSSQELTEVGKKVVAVAERELQLKPVEYDSNVLKYSSGNREPWCADFVSWVYKEAGVPFSGGASGGWRIAAVLNLQKFFQNTPGYEYFEVGQKPPQPGDVAFYIGSQTPDGGSTRHVNIVTEVNDNVMMTIGGNESDTVKKSTRKIEKGSMSLVGFGRMVK